MSKLTRDCYINVAKSLKEGCSMYTSHDGCTTSSKMWVYHSSDGWGGYCNKCGSKGFTSKGIRKISDILDKSANTEDDVCFVNKVTLPDDITYDPNEFCTSAKVWLYLAGITNDDIRNYRLGYSEKLYRVIIPVYDENNNLLMWQGRGLTEQQTKYYNVRGVGKSAVQFCSWCTVDSSTQPTTESMIVVEDALSVMRVGKHIPTQAILGTSLNISTTLKLAEYNRVGFWLDDDLGGWNGSNKAMRKLGLLSECVRIRTNEDPKKLTNSEIVSTLKQYNFL